MKTVYSYIIEVDSPTWLEKVGGSKIDKRTKGGKRLAELVKSLSIEKSKVLGYELEIDPILTSLRFKDIHKFLTVDSLILS